MTLSSCLSAKSRVQRFASLLLLLVVVAGAPAAPAPAVPGSTNGMLWVCEGGWAYSGTNMVLRDRVRVLDHGSGMYLECDLLTMTFQTNAVRPVRTNQTALPRSTPAAPATPLDTSRLETIVAEGNVSILTADQQIVGDRAVYSATNDLIIITGEMVILGREEFVGLGRKVVFNRATGIAHGEGPFAFESLGQFALGATNAPARKRPTDSPPTAVPPSSP